MEDLVRRVFRGQISTCRVKMGSDGVESNFTGRGDPGGSISGVLVEVEEGQKV